MTDAKLNEIQHWADETALQIGYADSGKFPFPRARCVQLITDVNRLLAEVRRLRAENERLKLMAFRPVGDNHHNAAMCPYCSGDDNGLTAADMIGGES